MKVRIQIILALLTSLLLTACYEVPENTNIPYAMVSFLIAPYATGADNGLVIEGNCHLYDTTHPAVMSAGHGRYGFNGVLVVRGLDGNLYAFDAACPNEVSKFAQLQPDGYLATCPLCGSSFELGNGSGYPLPHAATTQPLKRYNVRSYGNYDYKVTN